MEKDSYPWIIWYIWKAMNDKLSREIDRVQAELIMSAQGECHVWFTTNEPPTGSVSILVTTSHVLCLNSICLVDGSWTSTSIFSRCGWMWKDNNGRIHHLGLRNQR